MPAFPGCVGAEILNAEGGAKVAQRVGRLLRPSGAGELEGVDPRAEAVSWESAEEAFFGSMAVRYDGAAAELFFEDGPE